MSLFYKSQRIGKGGKAFFMYKFRTLKEGSDSSQFAGKESYTRFGRFLRKTKLDELPQLFNVVKGDLNFFGYRAEEKRTMEILPEFIQEKLKTAKPGLVDIASAHFFDEEKLMQMGNANEIYWAKIRPIKFAFQVFYIDNKCFLLDLAIGWITFKKILGSFFK